MDQIIYTALSGVLGTLGGSIGAYAIAKRMFNTDRIMEIGNELLTEAVSNKDVQEKIYVVGAILGKGVGAGVGLSPKGGKFKIEDGIALAIQQFLPNILGKITGQQPQQQTQQEDNRIFGALP